MANEALWGVINTLVRISSSLFILRVFRARYCRFANWSLIALSLLCGIATLLEALLICRPVAANWDPSVNGSCGNELVPYITLEILGLLIDFGVITSPFYAIWRLPLSYLKRFKLLGQFSIGGL